MKSSILHLREINPEEYAKKFLFLGMIICFIITVQVFFLACEQCSWMLLEPSILPPVWALFLSNFFYEAPSHNAQLVSTLAVFTVSYTILALQTSWQKIKKLMVIVLLGLTFVLSYISSIAFLFAGINEEMAGISGITSAMVGLALIYTLGYLDKKRKLDLDGKYVSFTILLLLTGIIAVIYHYTLCLVFIIPFGAISIYSLYKKSSLKERIEPAEMARTIIPFLVLLYFVACLFPSPSNNTNTFAHYTWLMAGLGIGIYDLFLFKTK